MLRRAEEAEAFWRPGDLGKDQLSGIGVTWPLTRLVSRMDSVRECLRPGMLTLRWAEALGATGGPLVGLEAAEDSLGGNVKGVALRLDRDRLCLCSNGGAVVVEAA